MTAARFKTQPERVRAAEMRAEAVKLRKMGLSYPQIAERLGYNSRQAAHQAVTTALRDIREETADDADDLRTLEAERLDQLWQIAFTEAVSNRSMRAIDTLMRIQERRAKLFGLDKSDERMADAIQASAEAATANAEAIYTIMVAILHRLDLTPEQQAAAPAIIVAELEAIEPSDKEAISRGSEDN